MIVYASKKAVKIRNVVVAVALLGAPALLTPQSGPPQSAAVEQFGAWLHALNRPDGGAAFRQFIENNAPSLAKYVDQDLAFRDENGGFELLKSEESTPTRYSGLLKERDSDHFSRFLIEVEPDEPHRILKLNLRGTPQPAEFPIARLTQGELLSALRTKLDHEAAADRFSGAVMVARNGETVFSGAYGLANREQNVKVSLNTRFCTASMVKMFTAVAILQLVQAGKVKLEDSFGTYLNGYPNHDAASRVTIHQLLTHTGGTGDFFGPEYDLYHKSLRNLADYPALFGNRSLRFEPGSRWDYSNYGFILLGLVIERASGESYYTYVRKHIFKPARMTATGPEGEFEQVPHRAVGYTKTVPRRSWLPTSDIETFRGTSAGGGFSTVGDMLRFANALNTHKLLDERHIQLLTSGKITAGTGKYAYGFKDEVVNGIRWTGHGGAAPGMNGDLRIFPNAGYVVAVLSNLDPPAASRIAEFVANRLPNR